MAFAFSGKSVLITGGTGSLGTALLESLLDKNLALKQIVIFSRDELKQSEQKRKYIDSLVTIRWVLGDIRDYDALSNACRNIDIIFHLAALKQVPACEENPEECFKINTFGTSVLIRVANDQHVSKVIAVSTDKAVQPISTYGASKFMMEQLVLNADLHSDTQFSIGRFGNFINSRGSIFPLFRDLIKEGKPLTVTDLKMTRFCIAEHEVAQLLTNWITSMQGSEIFVPKMRSYAMHQIVEALEVKENFVIIGRRSGERLYENLVTPQDELLISESKDYYVFMKRGNRSLSKESISKQVFVYRSDQSDRPYTNAEIKSIFTLYSIKS